MTHMFSIPEDVPADVCTCNRNNCEHEECFDHAEKENTELKWTGTLDQRRMKAMELAAEDLLKSLDLKEEQNILKTLLQIMRSQRTVLGPSGNRVIGNEMQKIAEMIGIPMADLLAETEVYRQSYETAFPKKSPGIVSKPMSNSTTMMTRTTGVNSSFNSVSSKTNSHSSRPGLGGDFSRHMQAGFNYGKKARKQHFEKDSKADFSPPSRSEHQPIRSRLLAKRGSDSDDEPQDVKHNDFKTGMQQYREDQKHTNGSRPGVDQRAGLGSGPPRRVPYYGSRPGQPHEMRKSETDKRLTHAFNQPHNPSRNQGLVSKKRKQEEEEVIDGDDEYKGLDPKLVEIIKNEILDLKKPITWDDIAGLGHAKKSIMEIVVWPMLRPEVFKGLRAPPKGLLLFGPPGTGKTMIGKCIANEAGATFFSISASSMTSKFVGEGEKLVRTLFGVAKVHSPAVVFIDEIDSLLTQRSENEHESARRIKTEFLVQMDGVGGGDERILVVGATNRPTELDEAARRRFVKRLYIPLPDGEARLAILDNLLQREGASLTDDDKQELVEKTDGYSGADMANLCKEAALGPLREITDIRNVNASQIRAIDMRDFNYAMTQVRASVSEKDLDHYLQYAKDFGSIGMPSSA
eukprot:Clim_evm24s156 gene=Clim_evmTU24s156